jgi:hypothetical protein
MQAVHVDFFDVPYGQTQIDERLVNWARWCKPQHTSYVLPMFRHYKPYKYPESAGGGVPIDSKDALVIQKTMHKLPERHRLALGWCYVIRSNPARAAHDMGTSKEGLKKLIEDARVMVINLSRQPLDLCKNPCV